MGTPGGQGTCGGNRTDGDRGGQIKKPPLDPMGGPIQYNTADMIGGSIMWPIN